MSLVTAADLSDYHICGRGLTGGIKLGDLKLLFVKA